MVISSLSAGEIKVAVAANVSYAIDALKEEFHKLRPNTDVKIVLGGSGKLTAQILHGAPYQLFMSANMKYPKALYKEKIAVTEPVVYAQGSLAILSSKKRDFSQGIALIASKKINKIAIANPKIAPYGTATLEAIKNAKLPRSISKKFVYAESISRTLTYTISATDIGFVAKSLLFSPKMKHYKQGIHWSEVNSKLYKPINQGIVILKNGDKNSEVKAFYDFMFSRRAQEILNDFGYLIP